MTLSERIARVQAPACGRTGTHGAHVIDRGEAGDIHAWCMGTSERARTPPPAHTHGWAPDVRCVACVGLSPFTRRALRGELPAKGLR